MSLQLVLLKFFDTLSETLSRTLSRGTAVAASQRGDERGGGFASNHFHLLVWARGAALASFMQYLRSNLSKKVGRLVDWSGGFGERRYSAEPVLGDTALVGRLRYVLGAGGFRGALSAFLLPAVDCARACRSSSLTPSARSLTPSAPSAGAAPLLSAYSASKHATLGWAKCLKFDLADTGIEVSNILVPSVSSNMFVHAPTMFDRGPTPVPPTYDVDVVGRAVVRAAKRPGRTLVPVFLQGWLILAADTFAPWAGDFLLSRFGKQMQMRDQPVDRPEGNLFKPMPRVSEPQGPVRPTALWKRFSATAALVALAGGAVLGVAGAARAAR